MPYVITEACIGTKDKACVDVCPVDCIYEGAEQLYHPPGRVHRLRRLRARMPGNRDFPEEDVPGEQKQYVQINREVFKGRHAAGIGQTR